MPPIKQCACNPENHSVTFILNPCPAITACLGVIITKGQTQASHTEGFKLLKDNMEVCFYGNRYPKIFLTDQAQAETFDLQTVRPESKNYLYTFHVLQTVWR